MERQLFNINTESANRRAEQYQTHYRVGEQALMKSRKSMTQSHQSKHTQV